MTIKYFLILALLFEVATVYAQTNTVRINPNIILPKDSSESKLLITSLNEFLSAVQNPNKENKFFLESEKVETLILFDKIIGIEKSERFKDDYFYKPYLSNVVALKDTQYLLQVSYIGTNDNSAYLRIIVEFIGHKTNITFLFSSALLRNTKSWKVKKINNNIFHYQTTINKEKVNEFNKLTTFFDLKLKSANKVTEYYCFDNIIEMQKLIGVDYISDYNGRTESVWSSSFGEKKLIAFGNNNSSFNQFDPHDLWHDRLSLVISRSKVNKPVDEGCAYLYGGSWGLTWKEIFRAFKEQVAINKNTNWIEVKENRFDFKTKEFNNSADNIVNALLVKKIEKEKGFVGVWELLNVGPVEKGNEKYFQTLEKLTGITKANYNDKVWELINNEK